MIEYITRACKAVGHPEVSFAVAEESRFSADWLRDYFESQVLEGKRFRANETIQIGWMIAQLKDNDGRLEIWEPDFDSMPIKWCRGVNNTLRHLVLQQAVCKEIKCEPDFPSLRQAGVASVSFLDHQSAFVMSRGGLTGAESGWRFYKSEEFGINGEFKSLYEIALHRAGIIPFLALPEGASIKRSDSMIELNYAGKQLTSQKSELLRKITQTTVFV